MASLLYLKANPKSDGKSRTFQISERFFTAYKASHPGDEIITLDLYRENIRPLTGEEVTLTHQSGNEDYPMIRYARQFHNADKYIIAAPCGIWAFLQF